MPVSTCFSIILSLDRFYLNAIQDHRKFTYKRSVCKLYPLLTKSTTAILNLLLRKVRLDLRLEKFKSFHCRNQKRFAYISRVSELLTAFVISPFIVPDRAAAIPNLPLLRMCMAILKPSPTSAKETHQYLHTSRYPGNAFNIETRV